MDSNLLNNFDEIFKDLKGFTPEKIEGLVQQSLKFFEYLRTKLESSDPKEREEALVLAQELQKKLETQAEKALQESGMSRTELDAFLSSQANFSPDQWRSLEKTQHDLSAYQADLIKSSHLGGQKSADAPRRLKRSKIHKIQG